MSIYTPSRSVLTMPIPGTKLAPEKFKGEYNYVSRFIQHYERLCDQNNVTLAKEKCETVTQYCSKKVGEFIEALESYSKSDWDQLKGDLLKFYDNDRSSKRYRQKDILAYTEETKLKKIKDLSTWKRYTRGFVCIGGWLKSKTKISEDEHATYFWQGIPRTLRMRIENRLLAQDPTRSLATPWPVEKVEAAAEAILQRDRFDRNLIDSDEEEQDETDEEDSQDEADSSDEDSEAELKRLKRKTKRLKEMSAMRKAKKKTLTKKYIDSDDEDEPRQKKASATKSAPSKANNQQEVEELIKQLNTMSLDDPGYGFAYFKAIKLDKDVEKVVRRPLNGSQNQSRAPGQNNRRDAPPHMGGPQQGGFMPRPPMRCFGCGEIGHGISNCQKTNELIQAGVLAHDHAGRIVRGDGTYLHRIAVDEPFTVAVERERKAQNPQSNLVTFSEPDKSFFFGEDDSEREDEVDGAWMREIDSEGETEHFVFPVDAKKRTTAEAARKKANDKVYPEPLPPGVAKGKERMKQPPRADENNPGGSDPSVPRYGTRRNMQGKELTVVDNPGKVRVPVPINPKPKAPVKEKEVVIEPTPVTIREPEWDPEDEGQMIEDEAAFQNRKEKRQIPSQPLQDKTNDRKKPNPRQSAVSAHVDPMAVLTRLLSTPVQLQVGEVLGVSKELSGLLNDSIKLKAGKPLVATSFITRTRGVLIKLHMECDGVPITAIVDTGSQLNIVSKSVWKSAIKRPMDIAKTLAMNDANGGEGILRGLVQHVPLSCGNVVTEANLYVGEHVPFQLLLGRPWQRGNYVSIDERIEGTYLLFKDPKNLEVRYEIMVGIEAPDPSWSFDPAQFAVPANLLITVPETHEATPFQLQETQPRFSDQFSNWKLGYLIWKALFVLLTIMVKIVLYSLWAFVPVAKNLFQGTRVISDMGKGDRALEYINGGAVEFSSNQNLENYPPPHLLMNNSSSGHIFNACVHENRAPIVPSTYTCSFLDRTDPEILDRVQSELAYHRRTGFNLQTIIGSNSATEIAPVFENGRLARRTVLHEATVITNGNNEEDPNIMCGDILMKFFPRIPVVEGPVYFPTWRSMSPPVSQTQEGRLPSQIESDPSVGTQPHSLYVDVPDRETLIRDPSMARELPHLRSSSRTSSHLRDSAPRLTSPSPPVYSPTLAEASNLLNFSSSARIAAERTPTPFPFSVPPVSVENTPSPSRSLPHTPVLTPVRVQLSELKTRLDELQSRGLVRAESCDSPEETPPVAPPMMLPEPMVVDIEEMPVTCDNRQAKRRKIGVSLPKPPTRRNLNKEMMKRKRLQRVLEFEEEEDQSDEEETKMSTPVAIKKPFTSIQELERSNATPTDLAKTCQGCSYSDTDNGAHCQVPGNNERLASSEDDETIASTQTTATLIEPFQGDPLFSDDESSPIRIRPPTRRDVVFSDNPNMPSLSFHVAVSAAPFQRMRSPSQTLTEPGYDASQSIFNVAADREFFKNFIRNKLAPAVPHIPWEKPKSPTHDAQDIATPWAREKLSSTCNTKSSIYSLLNEDSGGSSIDSLPPLVDLADDEASRGSANMDLESESQNSTSQDLMYPFTLDELNEDKDHIINDSERLPVIEKDLYYIREIDDMTIEEAIDAVEEPDLPFNYEEALLAADLFLLTQSQVIDVSHCKTVRGRLAEVLSASNSSRETLGEEASHGKLVPQGLNSNSGSVEQLWDGAVLNQTTAAVNYFGPCTDAHAYNGCSPHSHEESEDLRYIRHLKAMRVRLNETIEWVGKCLTREDWRDVFDDSLNILVETGAIFREIQVNKDEYFRETARRSNGLLTETENHFLRSAAGRFRFHGRRDLHDALVDIISARTTDSDIIQQLLHAGCLDGNSSEPGALRMLALLEETIVERRE
jgi:hypothetical protein